MIYIVVGAVIILVVIVVLIIHVYKADNMMIEFTKKINTSYEQINSEMHRRADKVNELLKNIMPYIMYSKDLEQTTAKIKKSLDTYFSAGTRDYQVNAHLEITKNLDELINLIDTKYPDTFDDKIKSLIEEIKESDEKITFSKNIYNSLVQNYNAYISKFLNKSIAKMFKYKKMEKLGEQNEKA